MRFVLNVYFDEIWDNYDKAQRQTNFYNKINAHQPNVNSLEVQGISIFA